MEKRILLLGGNFYPEPTGIGKYTGEMIDFFASQNYKCTVITSFPYYPYWKIQPPYSRKKYWYKREIKNSPYPDSIPIEIYRCPQYVPANPTTLRRVLLDFSFCISSCFVILMLLFRPKYDYVISISPCFITGLLAILYKTIKGGKFLYHIQDIQIDAAKDLKLIKSELAINLLLKIELFILRKADLVSSISAGMIKRIVEKCNRDIFLLPNWVDTRLFFPLNEKSKLKEEFNFSITDKIIMYSGAIGEKQGLEAILYAAESLQNIPDLKFVISGSGPYKVKLITLKDRLKLNNVFFMPLQPIDSLNRFLNMADIHLILQKSTISDCLMPSKLSTILSVGGVAIITANQHSSLYEFVEKNGIGILVEPENQTALTAAIQSTIEDKSENLKQNARTYAEQFLSIEKIIPSYTNNLN
jgi:colanic acid biosynthesis glycosyl transferase WcaI